MATALLNTVAQVFFAVQGTLLIAAQRCEPTPFTNHSGTHARIHILIPLHNLNKDYHKCGAKQVST